MLTWFVCKGKVIVSASSIEVGNAGDLLFRIPSELWTKDVPGTILTLFTLLTLLTLILCGVD